MNYYALFYCFFTLAIAVGFMRCMYKDIMTLADEWYTRSNESKAKSIVEILLEATLLGMLYLITILFFIFIVLHK